jgi:hypothetical protein
MKRNTLAPAALALALFIMFDRAPSLAQEGGRLSAEQAEKIGVEAVVKANSKQESQ